MTNVISLNDYREKVQIEDFFVKTQTKRTYVSWIFYLKSITGGEKNKKQSIEDWQNEFNSFIKQHKL